jgi:hypothetical protein
MIGFAALSDSNNSGNASSTHPTATGSGAATRSPKKGKSGTTVDCGFMGHLIAIIIARRLL